MQFTINTISCPTLKPIDIIDITDRVKTALEDSGMTDGQITIISQHTTAYVNINEKESHLVHDMITFLKRLVPKDRDYLHNLDPVDGRDNAHSHLIGLFMNSSETIPFANGRLLIGEWQSIFLVELDGPREQRKVILQIAGN
jgi:secondary thiamine-phosphate synthase enzyme